MRRLESLRESGTVKIKPRGGMVLQGILGEWFLQERRPSSRIAELMQRSAAAFRQPSRKENASRVAELPLLNQRRGRTNFSLQFDLLGSGAGGRAVRRTGGYPLRDRPTGQHRTWRFGTAKPECQLRRHATQGIAEASEAASTTSTLERGQFRCPCDSPSKELSERPTGCEHTDLE